MYGFVFGSHYRKYCCLATGEYIRNKQKTRPLGRFFVSGGRGWIRTTEVTDDRFTVERC